MRKMICSCCGRWSVEEITVIVPRYGSRKRLRIRGPAIIKDVANAAEAAAILSRHGKLEFMREADTT